MSATIRVAASAAAAPFGVCWASAESAQAVDTDALFVNSKTTVPEPSTCAMGLMGFADLGDAAFPRDEGLRLQGVFG